MSEDSDGMHVDGSTDAAGATDAEPKVDAQIKRRRTSTVARLLTALAASNAIPFDVLARRIGIAPRKLAECQEGTRELDLETQARLAAVVTASAPQHAKLARRLQAQAQSALRIRDGSIEGHQSYYLAHYWENV
jgi:hypothetical protein